MTIDEHLFPIEDIHAVVGDLAVDKQWQVCVLHGFQRRVQGVQFSDAGLRVGGGTGGVQFYRVYEVAVCGAANFPSVRGIGQVEGHQRLEAARQVGHGGEDALPISAGGGHRGHRRGEVGHHDSAAEIACHVGTGMRQGAVVAQVDVPVIGAEKREFSHSKPRQEMSAGMVT